MKAQMKLVNYISLIFVTIMFFGGNGLAQFTINANDIPSAPGICIITEDDVVDGIGVDVGLPGANRVWRFDHPYPSVLTRQVIMKPEDTPFADQFPDANLAIRYDGKLGHIVHSYYFDDIAGDIYGYQRLTPRENWIHGFGADSALAKFKDYEADVRGSVNIDPNVLLHAFPLRYGKTWKSVSDFRVEGVAEMFGLPLTLSADIKDSVHYVVDGWGTIILPTASYRALRVKSYITLVEDLFINGVQTRSRKTRTINYHWIAQKYGIVARVISYSNEPDDGFLMAKQVSRLHIFAPKIEMRIDNYSGRRGDIFEIPIQVSDLTDLDITSIEMKIGFDGGKLIPLEVISQGTLTEKWGDLEFSAIESGMEIKMIGDEALAGDGVLCYLKLQANPNATDFGLTTISFDEIIMDKSGPLLVPFPGRFVLLPGSEFAPNEAKSQLGRLSSSPAEFKLMQNYPNPFNPQTTIEYHLPSNSSVTLRIFDMQGRLINTLVQESKSAGYHHVTWNGRDYSDNLVASGTYYYRIDIKSNETNQPTFSSVKKLIFMK